MVFLVGFLNGKLVHVTLLAGLTRSQISKEQKPKCYILSCSQVLVNRRECSTSVSVPLITGENVALRFLFL